MQFGGREVRVGGGVERVYIYGRISILGWSAEQ
jgi:hypothetical protein